VTFDPVQRAMPIGTKPHRLIARGAGLVRDSKTPGRHRLFTKDPVGNRIELLKA
jgi:hypothetical protein